MRRSSITSTLGIALSAILGGGIVTYQIRHGSFGDKIQSVPVESRVLIPGTSNFDLDEMRFFPTLEKLSGGLAATSSSKPYSLALLSDGAKKKDCDIFLDILNRGRFFREQDIVLRSRNETRFSYLGEGNPLDINIDQLRDREFYMDEIRNSNGWLDEGSNIGVETEEGRYILHIVDWIPLKDRKKGNIKKYDLLGQRFRVN